MIKRYVAWALGLIIIVMLISGMKYIIDDVTYYSEADRLNSSLDIEGIKLLMTGDEVHTKLGKEDKKSESFEMMSYLYEYSKLGIWLSVANLSQDPDLENKLCEIRFSDSQYSVYDLRIGMDEEKANEILVEKGYKKIEVDRSENIYIKGCIKISLKMSAKLISEIRIQIVDKYYDPDVVY